MFIKSQANIFQKIKAREQEMLDELVLKKLS